MSNAVAIWSVCVTGAVALGVPLVAERAARRRQNAERITQLELAKLDDLRQVLDAGFDVADEALSAAQKIFAEMERAARAVHDAQSLHTATRAAQAKERDVDQPSSSTEGLLMAAELSERLDTALQVADETMKSVTVTTGVSRDALTKSVEGIPLVLRRLWVRLSADDPAVDAYRDVLTHLRAINAAGITFASTVKDSTNADDQQVSMDEALLRRLKQNLESSDDGLARYAARAQQLVGIQHGKP